MMIGYGEGFATAYDHFWAAYPTRMAQLWLDAHRRLAPDAERSLLDVGCGTGIITQRFHAEGYSVIGLDISAAMLDLARARLADARPGTAVLFQADAADFEAPRRSAFALSNYDVPNHLGGIDRVHGYLRCVHRAVLPGGWLGFDLSTLAGLQAQVPPVKLDDETASVAVHRGEPAGGDLPLHISGEVRGPQGAQAFQTTISNSGYPMSDVLSAARDAGWTSLSVVSARDLVTPVPEPEAETRVAILCQRPPKQG